ncbi:MAG: hypothetical protein WCP28_09385 [Actinomycetes bacterium]
MAGVLLTTGLTLTACATNPAQPASTPSSESQASQTWMTTLYDNHPDTVLGSILIPGTHDSGSFGIGVTSPCQNALIAGAAAEVGALLRAEPCMLAGFSRAQDVGIDKQLESGVRYLDIRVGVPANAVVKSNGGPVAAPADPLAVPLVTHHTVISAPLKTSLDAILAFVTSHPKEQVIVDFQHFDLPKDPNVVDYYTGVLDAYLRTYSPPGLAAGTTICSKAWDSNVIKVPDSDLATKVTFKQVWDAGRNLAVLVDPAAVPSNPCYRNRDAAILSQWPKTQDPTVSTTYNSSELTARRKKLNSDPPQCVGTQSVGANPDGTPKSGTAPGYWCGFFVSQMQLSTNSKTYASCVVVPKKTCSLFNLSTLVNNQIGTQMAQWSRAGLPDNIAIADYFQYSEPSIVETMVERNRQMLPTG